jgi:hypothetical protein
MKKVLIRFRKIKDNEVLEVCFDERLSFTDNLKLLREINGEDHQRAMIYDPIKRVFLKRNVPLKCFNFKGIVSLHLFDQFEKR